METKEKQMLMIRANYKLVSESVRLSVKISTSTTHSFTFAGMKIGNDNLTDSPGMQNVSDDVIRCSGKQSVVYTASLRLFKHELL